MISTNGKTLLKSDMSVCVWPCDEPSNLRTNLSFRTPYLVVQSESKHNICLLNLDRRGAGGDQAGVVASFRVQRDLDEAKREP